MWSHRTGRRWVIAAVLVALAVAAFGGFRRADAVADALPVSSGRQTVETQAFAITPRCAWLANRRPGQPASAAGEARYLMLRATVVGKSADWVGMRAYLDKDVIWLPQGAGDPVWPERSQRADDATLGFTPAAGLPVVVDFVWEVPAARVVPAISTWGLFKRRHVERTYASGEAMWVQDGPGAKFRLPVRSTCEETGA